MAGLVISWNTIRLTGTRGPTPRAGARRWTPPHGPRPSQVDLTGLLDQLLQLGHLGLLLRRDDVQRLEAVVDVHAEPRPRLALVGGRTSSARRGDRGCGRWTTPPHSPVRAAGDRLGLGGRLHDDQGLRPAGRAGPGASSRGRSRRSSLSGRLVAWLWARVNVGVSACQPRAPVVGASGPPELGIQSWRIPWPRWRPRRGRLLAGRELGVHRIGLPLGEAMARSRTTRPPGDGQRAPVWWRREMMAGRMSRDTKFMT